MAQDTTSRRILNNLKDDLVLKEGISETPKYVAPTIQPVYVVNGELANKEDVLATVTALGTVYTTRNVAGQRFYLKHAELAICGASDQGTSPYYIGITVNGVAYRVAIASLTTTVINSVGPVLNTNGQACVDFISPIPIDNATNITFSGPNLADASGAATITGYYADVAV